jgi:hypothetical protein
MMNMDGMRMLAAGIARQAAKDRTDSERMLMENPGSAAALARRRELDAFFSGAWFRCLKDINPDIGRAEKEARR